MSSTTNGFTITGEFAGDHFGRAIVGLSDFNGDGINDFAVGADNFNSDGGKVYIIFGSASPTWPLIFSASIIGSSVAGLQAVGPQNSKLGFALTAGDFDHDGLSDVAGGAMGISEVLVIYGSPNSNGAFGTIFRGNSSSDAGNNIAAVMRFNGKNVDDLKRPVFIDVSVFN